MKIDSLDELEYAFAEWRRAKRHAREPVPEELLSRARRATKQHGVPAVVGVTRVERSRLFRTRPARSVAQGSPSTTPRGVAEPVPAFSRLELSAPSTSRPRPMAEVESSGVTLRVFEHTPEMMGLLWAVCGLGGGR